MTPAPETTEVLIVRTGTANLASVIAGLERAGVSPRMATDAVQVESAPFVVLPGVGAFAAAMHELEERKLVAPLRARIEADRPTLAVCLGLQMLAEESEESPGVKGLGILPVRVARFPERVRVPQLGWNQIQPDEGCRLLTEGFTYFANSYRLTEAPPGWGAAWSDHGGPFVAALERGRILGCQFHPELSGPFGLSLLQRWLTAGGVPC